MFERNGLLVELTFAVDHEETASDLVSDVRFGAVSRRAVQVGVNRSPIDD